MCSMLNELQVISLLKEWQIVILKLKDDTKKEKVANQIDTNPRQWSTQNTAEIITKRG